jgi:hypothetical protein
MTTAHRRRAAVGGRRRRRISRASHADAGVTGVRSNCRWVVLASDDVGWTDEIPRLINGGGSSTQYVSERLGTAARAGVDAWLRRSGRLERSKGIS